ncbi:sensor histidine kinase [Fibrella forsythiae]|uniref:Histidine kinase n=1 Tax=Fibrella forsythiae TaxID=2817061 RepID=A0ABS3JRG3_9BACT|nr:sensor histidine kinase [Fibrella forsythiae]MBO0952597.1 histidine kinase [Fibrella forsythiae]
MKLPAYSRYDSLLQAVVLPLHIGSLNWIFIGNEYWSNETTFGFATFITLVITFVNWLVNNTISLRLHGWYPEPGQYFARIGRQTVACLFSSCTHSCLIFSLYKLINLPGFIPNVYRLGFGVLSTAAFVLLVVAIYEGIHNFSYWQQSRREVDTLSRAQLQAQLDTMRQQVNPHFLFNSLTSLISLIDEDPRQASTFAEELSTVYRYLLRSNECSLTSLANELEFIQSYYHLLKTRHGDALTLVTRVQPGAELYQLPPLTLQLLIENAVKHNVVLPDQPLTVSLTAIGQQLIVSNNLQRKQSRILSTGIGLSNILARYQALGDIQPVVEEDGQEFKVTLPLL